MARETPETGIASGRAFAPRVRAAPHPLSFGGAKRPPTLPQQIAGFSALGLLIGGLIAAATPTLHILHGLFFTAFAITAGLRLAAAFVPRKPLEAPALSDADLPLYTVIAPLYREASVAPELVANLMRLDYPRERLQVLVMLEADDLETRATFAAMRLPSFIQVIVAPPGAPKTKPRACNVALERALG
jgi:cellulose synthase/poly-beta-1,6-N-acetylglucosamine synthase-like glycosyltransferase